MLRTLGRNGFVERSVLRLFLLHFINNSFLSSIAARRHKTLLVRGRYAPLALRPTTSAFTHSRLLATTTPQIKSDPSTSKSTAPIPPEPNASIPRKPKVDLKPAPVKPIITKTTLPELVPTSQAASNLRIDGSKQRPSAESADQPSTAASSATSLPTIAGSVEEARRDVKKAEEQGVLAPPPADAGRVRRLLHHAKEFFVRIIIFLFTNIAASESWTERDRNFTGMVW
jgi:LETM1 and EF-hand domain-containing protein 1